MTSPALAPWVWPMSTVIRVIDGDTLVVRLTRDIGFHGTVSFDQKVRIAGINTPPGRTAAGFLAARWNTDNLLAAPPMTITTLKPYKYGDEYMANLLMADGRDVGLTLIDLGLALPWDGRGPRPGDLA